MTRSRPLSTALGVGLLLVIVAVVIVQLTAASPASGDGRVKSEPIGPGVTGIPGEDANDVSCPGTEECGPSPLPSSTPVPTPGATVASEPIGPEVTSQPNEDEGDVTCPGTGECGSGASPSAP
jgi:hypothetical protein